MYPRKQNGYFAIDLRFAYAVAVAKTQNPDDGEDADNDDGRNQSPPAEWR